jgi:hypothetical protein
MVVGHARRVCLPVPVFRSMARQPEDQDRGGARHAFGGSTDLELLLCVERAVLAGPEECDQCSAEGREGGEERRGGRVSASCRWRLRRLMASSEIAGDYGSKPLYRNLGYFSLICLLRVHTLLGDPTREFRTIYLTRYHN